MSSPRREELDDFEPKLTFRYVCETAVSWLFMGLVFLCPAIGITIIGLAADSINWGTGRGSQEANYLTAFVLAPGPANSSQYLVWMTKMLYLPQYYDTQTFSALIAAGCICAIGGFIVGPLSIVNYRANGQSVKLTKDKKASQRIVLLTCVILDALMFITATIVLIYDIPLFTTYNKFDWGTGHYGIKPKYFDPPLGEGHFDFPPDRKPQDDIRRVYRSPVHYNPLNWNCRLQGHVSSGQQHRIFQLCDEGLAARNLLVVLVGFELIVLISHGYSWWVERKGGPNSLGRLRLGSEEQIVPPPQEE